MFGVISSSVRAVLVFTILAGILFPVAITAVSRLAFRDKADGSLVLRDGRIVGSRLIAHKITDPKYFWYRPSASDYSANPSGATNLSPTSKQLLKAVDERKALYGANAPADLLLASGSGLDPDISPASALYQVPRIALARGLDGNSRAKLDSWLSEVLARNRSGIFGPSAINVMDLNHRLDQLLR